MTVKCHEPRFKSPTRAPSLAHIHLAVERECVNYYYRCTRKYFQRKMMKKKILIEKKGTDLEKEFSVLFQKRKRVNSQVTFHKKKVYVII